MKIKTISRTEEDYCRKTKHDITKVHRNRDPALHPFEKEREYTRALSAVKLDKIFAKPFVGALDGHNDSICSMSTVRNKVVPLISGSCDGELKVWDLTRRVCFWSAAAHAGFVRGIAPDEGGNSFYTCGDDKMIKQWSLLADKSSSSSSSSSSQVEPINAIVAPHALKAIDHHWIDRQYATVGESVCVWDGTRSSSDPIHSYSWGNDSLMSVKYNPAEASLLLATAADRSILLYDLRVSIPMRKCVLPMKSNKAVWNPLEPFNFVVANEDHNLYSFDMRNLSQALMIHKDHVSAVMDVAISPTGKECVSGGYDNTVRIFPLSGANVGRSREMYHSKRMQHVFSVAYSSDATFVLSGSDDTNIRIWKSNASKSLGIAAGREERKLKYLDTVKKRYQHLPEIKRIINDKHVPKRIKKANEIQHIQHASERRKLSNRIEHSREGSIVTQPERARAVIKEFK